MFYENDHGWYSCRFMQTRLFPTSVCSLIKWWSNDDGSPIKDQCILTEVKNQNDDKLSHK